MSRIGRSPTIVVFLWNFAALLTAGLPLSLFPQAASAEGAFGRQTLTGDWGGTRKTLATNGISLEAVYTSAVFSNISGGVRRAGVYLDNVDMTLTLNVEEMFGWKGASIFIYGLGDNGENPSRNSGDIQGISNIAAYNTWKLFEAWIQQKLRPVSLSVLLGLYDLNSEFDVLRSSNFFINPSHGIDPTFAQSGVNGPSIFPNTTIGLRLKWSPKPSFYLQTVVLNGVAGDPANPNGTRLTFAGSNGILSATEIALVNSTPVETTTSSGREHFHRVGRVTYPEYQGKVGLGFWFYTTEPEPVFAPPSDTVGHEVGGNLGLYLIAEQTVFHEKEEHEQYLRVFTRLGYANPKIYRFAYYVGGGFAYTGLIPGRDQDVSGIAVAGAYNGSEYKQYVLSHGRPVHSAEWNIEVSYRVMLAPWLRLQPDLQYIVHPNTNPALQNALTIGLQTVIIL